MFRIEWKNYESQVPEITREQYQTIKDRDRKEYFDAVKIEVEEDRRKYIADDIWKYYALMVAGGYLILSLVLFLWGTNITRTCSGILFIISIGLLLQNFGFGLTYRSLLKFLDKKASYCRQAKIAIDDSEDYEEFERERYKILAGL